MLTHPHLLKVGVVLSAAARHWPSSAGGSGLRAGWRPPEVWKSPPATLPPKQPSGAGVAAAFHFKQKARPWEASWRRVSVVLPPQRVVAPSPFHRPLLTLFPFPGFAWDPGAPKDHTWPSLGPLWVFQLIFHCFLQAHLLTAPPDHVGWEGVPVLTPCISGLSFLAHGVVWLDQPGSPVRFKPLVPGVRGGDTGLGA